jgi:uncharacterized protein (DUF433 family)
MARPVCDR